jgi:hypothetical protein
MQNFDKVTGSMWWSSGSSFFFGGGDGVSSSSVVAWVGSERDRMARRRIGASGRGKEVAGVDGDCFIGILCWGGGRPTSNYMCYEGFRFPYDD